MEILKSNNERYQESRLIKVDIFQNSLVSFKKCQQVAN